ncbi:MAG: malate permease [Miltoncostaeaceae bacterium]|jgi:predicted permease|nr:malate permease [Miltoncostaeaceae bacterium]
MTATAFGALLIILSGAVARRFGLLKIEHGPVLVRIVIHLALPPLIFSILVKADLHGSLLLVPVAGFAIHFVMLALVVVSARIWGMDRPRAGALIVATAVGNTGFFGLPLIAASGNGFSLAAAVMYDSLATGIITWTSTVWIATTYGREPGADPIDWRGFGKALLLPPNWALAAGLIVNAAGVHELPEMIERPLDLLGAAVLPLVMIYCGLMLDLRGLGRVRGEIVYAVVMRLGVAALVGLAIAAALPFRGDTFNTVVIMAAMPTAMMSLVIGSSRGLRADVIAGAVVITTLLSTATLPAVRALLL